MAGRDSREPTPKSEAPRAESSSPGGPRAEGAPVEEARAEGPPARAPAPLPLPGPLRATAPAHRPPWLVLLSALTLVYGGMLFVSSLETLRDPRAVAHLPVGRALTPAEDEI